MSGAPDFDQFKSTRCDVHDWIDESIKRLSTGNTTDNIDLAFMRLNSLLQLKSQEIRATIDNNEQKIKSSLPAFIASSSFVDTELKHCQQKIHALSRQLDLEKTSSYSRIYKLHCLNENIKTTIAVTKQLQEWDDLVKEINENITQGRAVDASPLIGELYRILKNLSKDDKCPALAAKRAEAAQLSTAVSHAISGTTSI